MSSPFRPPEPRLKYKEAETQARLATVEAGRTARLHAEGIVSDAEFQRAQAEAQSKRAAADNLKAAISKLEPELQVREQDRDVRQKQILGDIAKLEADSAISAATIHRLQYNIERRRIIAPGLRTPGRVRNPAPRRAHQRRPAARRHSAARPACKWSPSSNLPQHSEKSGPDKPPPFGCRAFPGPNMALSPPRSRASPPISATEKSESN